MNKPFIIILVIFLAILGTITTLVYLEVQAGNSSGLAFAKKYNQRACVKEVVRGRRICTDLSCFLENRAFFQTCMDHAKPSISLCETVPQIQNLFQFESWKNQQCKKLGRTDRNCYHIWQKVRNNCKAIDDKKKSVIFFRN